MAPAKIVNLKEHLEDGELNLSSSQLQEVPVKDILNLKKVTKLNLSNNRLTTLGGKFAQLNQLTKLNLANNSIGELPENFGNLKQLNHLNLSKNKLQNIPASFANLKQLRHLELKGNPLCPQLQQIVNTCADGAQCAKKVLQYCDQLQNEHKTNHLVSDKKSQQQNEKKSPKNDNKKTNKNKKQKDTNNTNSQVQKEANKKSTGFFSSLFGNGADSKNRKDKNKTKRGGSKAKKSSSYMFTLFKYILFVSVVIGSFVYLSNKFPEKYEVVRVASVKYTNKAISTLPENVQKNVYLVGDYVSHVYHQYTRPILMKSFELSQIGAVKTHKVLLAIKNSDQFKMINERLLALWNQVLSKVSELFRTKSN